MRSSSNPINRIDPFGLATETIIFTVPEVPIIYASEMLEYLFAAGIMVTESWYINGATDKLTSFPADELNSDMSHSTAGKNIEISNSETDMELNNGIKAAELSVFATSLYIKGVSTAFGNSGRLSQQLSGTKTSQAILKKFGKFKSPASRHVASNVNQNTAAKELNTVAEPWVNYVDDVAEINAGNVTMSGSNFSVNGRVYAEHGGTLYPISGNGLHTLNRAAFKALGVYNKFGNTSRALEILNKMGISSTDRAAALNVWRLIQ